MGLKGENSAGLLAMPSSDHAVCADREWRVFDV